ncbi:beta-ketoacyl-[acyl-carrier-protein] synthase family protein [Rheinheimera maricola]|uniref:Beta-ketoacyl-[acyl-carrier-protein] synthase family protein n=1 Tax=Rheinheimera maricola TaxID=2793282 RepID=A0ABS7XC61_9GAMM|nr:beta-ketoacyl-[acyl-carrier-protein] synthase family protein [Rheinheimera maricola]MBZ9613148.1 beta-ketoacyl-[acyl-carrier-protein] synthase family protein [Rheinheimera maricola]
MKHLIQDQDIVVIAGLGVFTPLGRDATTLADAILTGQCSIVPSENIAADQLLSNLTSEFSNHDTFGLDPALTEKTDRGVWFTLKALEEAMTSAGLRKADFDSERTAVVVGTSHSGIQHVEKIMKAALFGDKATLNPHDFYAALTDHVSTTVCEYLALKSIKVTISSACSSSNTAIGYGRDLLLSGQADRVIVIGTDTLSESIAAGFNSLKVLSKSPAAPFSSPSGISLGEGAGVLILENLASSKQRGNQHRGEVLGYALSSDAFHQTSVDDNGEGIETAIRCALDNAGVGLGDIDYISAHGTGTDSNDVPESQAVARVFGSNIKISSVKSSVGHTLGASGVVELIISLICAEKGYYAPNNHFIEPRNGCAALDYVHGPQQPASINTILCNNYGFGGNNSSLVVSRAAGVFGKKAPQQRKVYISGYGHCVADAAEGQDWLTQLEQGRSFSQNDDQYQTFIGKVALPTGAKNSARRSSPSIQFAVTATEHAIANFGLTEVMAEKRYETGLVAGLLHGAQKSLEKYMLSVFDGGLAYASSTQFPLTTLNAAAGEVSIKFGIKGFNTTLCGPVGSMKFGFDAIKIGHQERILDLSTDEMTPLIVGLCEHFQVLGKFDGDVPGEGFYLTEGASVTVLESGAAIEQRGGKKLAEVLAFTVNQDGIGHDLQGNGSQLAHVAKQALTASGLAIADIDLVIGVGQGSAAFMKNEHHALQSLFGDTPPQLTSAAMHLGYSPTAVLPQMVNLGAAILNGAPYWSADQQGAIWQPAVLQRDQQPRHILVLFTSVTFEHCALVLGKVE